jgi:hypothetical protein
MNRKRWVSVALSILGLGLVAGLSGCSIFSGVTIPPPVISTNPQPPPGVPGTAYPGFTFVLSSGGTPSLSWRETGALPPGLMFNGGTLVGTPTMAGSFPITVSVTDQSSPPQMASHMFTIMISPPPTLMITTLSPLPSGTAGVSYAANVSVSGGVQPYNFTLAAGSSALPGGLSLMTNGNQGVISGIPTAGGTTNNIIVQVSDAQTPPATATMTYSLMFNPPAPLMITTAGPLPTGTAGVAYGTAFISATGGIPPYTFALTAASNPLPAGLSLVTSNSQGVISGTPTVGGTTNNIIVQVSDAQTPAATATMTYSITINPPLPLTFNTASPLPDGGASIFYNSPISVRGGVAPYTFTLASGSAALPAGLSLTTQLSNTGLISGTTTVTGTTSNVIVQVADSQSPPAMQTMTYSLTIDPSTLYVGTQAPGDVWQMAISHATPTNGVMGFQDQGSNGLTGPLGGTFSQSFDTFPNGFLGLFFGTAVELPGQMALRVPLVAARFLPPVTDRVIAAVANTCPQLPATTNYQFVALADENFGTTSDAYGVAAVTQTAANTYNFTFNSFKLDATPGTSTNVPGLSCDPNLQVFSFTNASGVTSTVAISASGLMVIDNGTGTPAVGVQQPAANLSTTAILGGQYLGTVFFANDRTQRVCSRPPLPVCHTGPAPATDLVGFGPGSTTSISGGTYSFISSDPFSAHATDHIISLGTQTSPGLFPGGTLTIGGFARANFDVVVGQVNGKFVLFGVTLDTPPPNQPYAVLLIQQ